MPELDPENDDAIRVFQHVKLQAIYAGMDGTPVDLDYKSLSFALDMLEVENKPECFRKVLDVWHHCLALERLKKKRDSK